MITRVVAGARFELAHDLGYEPSDLPSWSTPQRGTAPLSRCVHCSVTGPAYPPSLGWGKCGHCPVGSPELQGTPFSVEQGAGSRGRRGHVDQTDSVPDRDPTG